MAEFAGLRRARGYVKAKLTRLRTQVLEASDETGVMFDKEQVETRLEKLEEIQREFETIQRQLLQGSDSGEDEQFKTSYFEIKTLLKRFMKQPPKEGAAETIDAITQLLQQQSELMQQIRHESRGELSAATTSLSSSTGNDTIAAILSRQTEILDRVANATGSNHTDNRVKLPTIKLPRFDGKIEDWKCFSDTFRIVFVLLFMTNRIYLISRNFNTWSPQYRETPRKLLNQLN